MNLKSSEVPMMTAEQKRERVRELGSLPQPRSAESEAELALLLAEVQAAEGANLANATQRMRSEREAMETRIRSLERLAERRASLLTRLEETLTEASAERQAIDGELASVLAGAAGHSGE
jgi:hypothetical protein